jgi:hypothetical protein
MKKSIEGINKIGDSIHGSEKSQHLIQKSKVLSH